MKRIIIVITLALILSLLLPFHFADASPALSETNLLAVSSDGNTFFAYFNTGSRWLTRSTDGGYTWTTADVGAGLNGNSLVALEISPWYSENKTIVAADSKSVYLSIDEGATFTKMQSIPLEGNITSISIDQYGQRVLVGTSTGTYGGGAARFNGESWTNLQIEKKDVYAVAFAPNYGEGWEALAFTYDGNSASVWNSDYPAATLYSGEKLTFQSAVIAFPADYYYEVNTVFVGANGSGSGPDLYRVHFPYEGSPTVTDLNVNGLNTSCNIHSIAISGYMSGGHTAVGLADSKIVKRSSNVAGSTVTWSDSTVPPRGTSNVELQFSPAFNTNNDNPNYDLFAITTGTGYGLYRSQDWGDTFLPFPPVPSQINNLTITAVTVNSISLGWTAPAGMGDNNTYYIRYLEGTPINADNWDQAVQAGVQQPQSYTAGTPESFTVKGLQPGTTYCFAIKTSDQIPNWSDISNSPSGKTFSVNDLNPPLPITDLKSIGNTSSSITLSWTAPGDPIPGGYENSTYYPPDGSSNIPIPIVFKWPAVSDAASYDFQLATNTSFSSLIDSQTGLHETSLPEEKQLQIGTTYSWRERAIIPPSPTSTPTAFRSAPSTAQSQQTIKTGNLTPLGQQPGIIGNWSTQAFTTMPLPTAHTQYDIRYSTSTIISNESWNSASLCTGEPVPKTAGSSETFTVTGLQSGTTYYFAVKTSDQAPNWSALSNSCSDTTQFVPIPNPPAPVDKIPPTKIIDLKVIDAAVDSITLQWTAPKDNPGSRNASYYDLRYTEKNPLDTSNWDSANKVSTVLKPKNVGTLETYTVTGLKPEITYYFAIKSADDVLNWSDMSNVANGDIKDTTPPAAINDLQFIDSSTKSATLTWTAPGDDGNVGTASQYDIRYTQDNGNRDYNTWSQVSDVPKPQIAGSKERATINGLNSNNTYYFIIRTADEVPNWAPWSGNVPGKTQTEPSPPPSNPSSSSSRTTPGTAGSAGSGSGSSSPKGPVFIITDLKAAKRQSLSRGNSRSNRYHC